MNKYINNLGSENILILGFAREGVSSYKFLRKYFPNKNIAIADRKERSEMNKEEKEIINSDTNLTIYLGNGYLNSLHGHDLVIKTPGIPNNKKEIISAARKGVKFTSQTQIFFDLAKGKIIGVTGTKGKSTTTTLIYEILKRAGLKTVMLGNIGKPALDYLEGDNEERWYIYELSSHQLSNINSSPHIAVFLNIFKEHLDYYNNFDDYLNAKTNITRFQKSYDYLIYNSTFPKITQATKLSKANKYSFSFKKSERGCFIKKGDIVFKDDKTSENIIKTDDIPLKGEHNLNNVMAAVVVAKILGINKRFIKRTIEKFKSLEHRIELVGKYKDIAFYDDTLATIPEATIAAIKALHNEISTIILGGFDRGQDFSKLADLIIEEGIENVILFPTTGRKIWKCINMSLISNKKKVIRHFFTNNMEDAVKWTYKYTSKDKICLLSAASSSFSIFKNYEDESNQYKYWITKLG